MQIIIILIIIALILYFLSVIWPIFVILAIIFAVWKTYEFYYYKSSSFLEIKKQINTYINDCNELNRHIEDLKHTRLISDRTDYGTADYQDSSKWKYQRKHLNAQEFAPNIHNCSRTVCSNAQKKPFEYVCKYFGIKATEENLLSFENILNNFEAAEEGKRHLQDEKKRVLDSVQNDIPALIRRFSKKKLEQNLGFEQIDMSTTYFPKYVFQYISSGGNASTQCALSGYTFIKLNFFR